LIYKHTLMLNMMIRNPFASLLVFLLVTSCPVYAQVPVAEWKQATTYAKGDPVTHSSVSYEAVKSTTGVTPGTDTAHWITLDAAAQNKESPGSPPDGTPDASEVGDLDDPGSPSGSTSDVKIVRVNVRGFIGTGDNMRIMGFKLSGSTSVLMRGVGPALGDYNLTGLISDPTMQLWKYDNPDDIYQGSTQDTNGANDNYTTNSNASAIVSAGAAIFPVTTLRSTEAASLVTLSSGFYTSWVWDKNNATGVGWAGVDMTDTSAAASFTHVSARGVVKPGDGAMFGGFEIVGTAGKTRKIFIRGRGTSLSNWKVTGTMSDPFIRLFKYTNAARTESAKVAENDNYTTSSSSSLIATYATTLMGHALSSNEPAILIDLEPGYYTLILEPSDGSSGIGWIGVDDVTP
jgi:hypothetical protein